MENKVISIATKAEVAKGLKELKDQMVFVGGAIVSLYTDDPSADEIRPTADIDLTVELLNYTDWIAMNERLMQLGFNPDPQAKDICSFKYNNIAVDIMPSENGPIGPVNKWYKIGFDNLSTETVETETISILSAPCFLATKFEAFRNRGSDYRLSHDFEDIIYVLDNRTTIVKEIAEDHPDIVQFLKEELAKVYQNSSFDEIITSHVHPLILEERLPFIKEKIQNIIEGI